MKMTLTNNNHRLQRMQSENAIVEEGDELGRSGERGVAVVPCLLLVYLQQHFKCLARHFNAVSEMFALLFHFQLYFYFFS